MKTEHRTKIKGSMAISQIILLTISIIAISYIAGSEIGFVSADATCGPNGTYCNPGFNDCDGYIGTRPAAGGFCCMNGVNCFTSFYRFNNNQCTKIKESQSQATTNGDLSLSACQAKVTKTTTQTTTQTPSTATLPTSVQIGRAHV